jgi:hypothetical protein
MSINKSSELNINNSSSESLKYVKSEKTANFNEAAKKAGVAALLILTFSIFVAAPVGMGIAAHSIGLGVGGGLGGLLSGAVVTTSIWEKTFPSTHKLHDINSNNDEVIPNFAAPSYNIPSDWWADQEVNQNYETMSGNQFQEWILQRHISHRGYDPSQYEQ